MGGNALKNTYTERKSKEEYFYILNELLTLLNPHVKLAKPIEAYRNKETFGDIDVLFVSDNSNITELIKNLFKPNEIYKNGEVWSFDFHKIQIDLIKTTEDNIDINLFYYSYNDISNLIGRSANRMGLKFGHLGLVLNYCNRDIVLTKDPREIYQFLGYDYDRYLRGFDDLEDLYEFVISSPYFSTEPFHNQNHSNRVRNAKRKVFIGFLEWLEKKTLTSYEFLDKSHYIEKALDLFNKREMIETIDKELEELKARNRKLNGYKLAKMFSISGEELGSFIKYIKALGDIDYSLSDEDFDDRLKVIYKTYLR